jgi:hypothetical protein
MNDESTGLGLRQLEMTWLNLNSNRPRLYILQIVLPMIVEMSDISNYLTH